MSTAVCSRRPQAGDVFHGDVEHVYRLRPTGAHRLRFALTEAQLADFRRDGFVVIRGAFTAAEVQAWRAALEDALVRHRDLIEPENLRFEYCHETDGAGRGIPWKVDPFTDLHPLLGEITRDRRICDPLVSIYGGHEPVIFKEKFIIKPPGSKGNGIHQDYNWWQGFPTSAISVAIAVDGADRSNGCTQLWPGSHVDGFLHTPGCLDGQIPAERTAAEPFYLETQPGDICLFGCYTIHAAGSNASDRHRRQIFLTYNSEADGEHYFAHRRHFWNYRVRGQAEPERFYFR